MSNKTENTNEQAKKEYQSPTLTNQGKLEQKTLSGALITGDATTSS